MDCARCARAASPRGRQHAHPDDRSDAEERHVDEAEVRRRQPREHQRGQRAAACQTVNDADDERAQREGAACHVEVRGRAGVLVRDAGVRVQPQGPAVRRCAGHGPARARRARSASPRRPARTRRPARRASRRPATRGRRRSRAAPPRGRCPTAPRAARPAAGPARPRRAPRRRRGDRDRARDARPSRSRATIRRTIPSRPSQSSKTRDQKDAAARKYHWLPPGAEKPYA